MFPCFLSHCLLLGVNLWNPTGMGMGIAAVLLTAFLLGMVHGITPDEHTWPITFSYAVGSYSWKGGMTAGLLFSLTFTLQRMIACELAYGIFRNKFVDLIKHPMWNFVTYIIVGAVMFGSGLYILRRGRIPHLLHTHGIRGHGQAEARESAPFYMPLFHGFIAGWGTGAFALITYVYLAPHMNSIYDAFLPGMFFGLGTLVMQMIVGALFGAWMARRKIHENARALMAKLMSGRTLTWAGLGFVIVGAFGLIFPKIGDYSINTGLHVHNLHSLGLGFFLAVIMLFCVAAVSFFKSLHDIRGLEFDVAAHEAHLHAADDGHDHGPGHAPLAAPAPGTASVN